MFGLTSGSDEWFMVWDGLILASRGLGGSKCFTSSLRHSQDSSWRSESLGHRVIDKHRPESLEYDVTCMGKWQQAYVFLLQFMFSRTNDKKTLKDSSRFTCGSSWEARIYHLTLFNEFTWVYLDHNWNLQLNLQRWKCLLSFSFLISSAPLFINHPYIG